MQSLDKLDIATPSDNGTEIELLHPVTKEPVGIFISVVGRHSEVYAKQRRKIELEQIEATKKLKDKDKLASMLDSEETKRRGVNLLAACVTGWRVVGDDGKESKTLHFDGQEHPFTTAAAVSVLSSRKWSWVYDQIDRAVHDDALFTMP